MIESVKFYVMSTEREKKMYISHPFEVFKS